ncbi:MAG: GNAT family N-acetyltransferase [Lachnospiraceae bacterium]
MKYEVKRATKEQMKELLDIQTEAFLGREPMTMALGMDEDGYRKSMEWMFAHGIDMGLLFVAVEEETNKVIGLAATYPSNFLDTTSVPEELVTGYEEAYDASGRLFEIIDRKLVDKPGYQSGTYLHLYYAATHKDYGKRGVATKLTEAVLNYGKELGYTHAYGETTNPKSLSVMLNNNGEIVDRIEYANCGIERFADVEGELVLVVKEL